MQKTTIDVVYPKIMIIEKETKAEFDESQYIDSDEGNCIVYENKKKYMRILKIEGHDVELIRVLSQFSFSTSE